jgi:hypothetical protein
MVLSVLDGEHALYRVGGDLEIEGCRSFCGKA